MSVSYCKKEKGGTPLRKILVALEEEELHQFIESFGLPTKQEWADAAGMKSFQQSIKLIRKQGYSIQVTKEHILGIAFPVYAKGKVVASLGMYMPESRCNASGIKEIISLIKKSAKSFPGLCNMSRDFVLTRKVHHAPFAQRNAHSAVV